MKRHLGFVMLTAFGGVGCSQAQALQDGVAFVADTAEEQGISVPGGEDSNLSLIHISEPTRPY